MSNTKIKSGKSETPLMSQYYAIKAKHENAILFFRMGDFYEMFGEDAKIGSKALGITLTSRGHGKAGDIPLAGFPHHALDGYLAKMVRQGFRVAICEQLEDPKLAKGIVKRDVIEVVTPGTVLSDNLLESGRNNFLAAVYCHDNECGAAAADISTGEFLVNESGMPFVMDTLQAMNPAEILIPSNQTQWLESRLNGNWRPVVTKQEDWLFGREFAYEQLTRHFGTTSLKGFGCEEMNAGLSAAGAILSYLKDTQRNDLAQIRKIVPLPNRDYMVLDGSTRRNLEILASMQSGTRAGTLLSVIDKTRTAMGGRMLAAWVQRPLIHLAEIQKRLDSVDALVNARDGRDALDEQLKGMGDIERLITKIVTNRATPRDLIALKNTLVHLTPVQNILSNLPSELIDWIRQSIDPCESAIQRIEEALTDDPPATLGNGQVFRKGYSPELDELHEMTSSGKSWIARLQNDEREATGIPSLKIGYNKVFGYYIEVTNTHIEKVPPHYIRKQTLVNGERFITPELKEMEEKLLKAEEKMMTLEQTLFNELKQYLSQFADAVQIDGHCIGMLDTLLSFSKSAVEFGYVKPDVHEGDEIKIEDGRHPVVERLLNPGDPYIPNDVDLNNHSDQVLIITGPNMAGKSTYLRQTGLIVLLAQIGSFVPAKSARIGIVDRIFTRVGAQDNLAGGESTFLIEMNETANILNNATNRSLVLLDEIGRGTSTFDGLSIAWAVAEYLHNTERVRPKTLFATHYHELTELAIILPRVKNYNVAVREWGDHIVFLRKIISGGCDHSYGIQVARLAGIPDSVIQRAKEILHNLEANELTPNEMPKLAVGDHAPQYHASNQLNIFMEQETRLRDALQKIDVNQLTPLEALQKLDELAKMSRQDS